MQRASFALVFAVLFLGAAGRLSVGGRLARDPKGAGLPEPTMEAACGECKQHEEHLGECTCFASDIMGTFE
eukprot:CAMPEP_0170622832 /NCGR_PEP_ID=MMETSP0224-20130122/29350_1 /TAXON_ID=285029 /ORGANISM="Togula jolla, Strain CCCM 725" /LENGTH=70 /DNA_ID=CAMNT_0010949195 /DNA_START=77 /DNA_END=286 /DNA_ORIENTATION=+